MIADDKTKISPESAGLTPEQFAHLGDGAVAYVKPMLSEDVMRLFPQAPKIEPGLQLFALLSATGTPLVVTDTRAAAVANAWEQDLQTVSLH